MRNDLKLTIYAEMKPGAALVDEMRARECVEASVTSLLRNLSNVRREDAGPTRFRVARPGQMQPLYRTLHSATVALQNCAERGMHAMHAAWSDAIAQVERDLLPNNNGFDTKSSVDLDGTRDDRLVLCTAFHHMDDAGCYAGWTEHDIIVRPHLSHGFTLRVTGRDRNGIKDYIGDTFHAALSAEVPALRPEV